MDFTFENQGTNTYLVYAVKPEDAIDSMSLGMLTNNKILGLAQTIFTQLDTNKYIKYNISAHVSVKQFFSGSVNKKRLIGVFKGIVNAMFSAEDYMIDTRSILMDLDYIFADVSTCETVLICLPIMEVENNQTDLGTFFKNILFSTQFDSTENCDYVAKIMNYLNSAPIFSLKDFKALLDEIDGVAPAKPAAPAAQPVVAPPVQKPVSQPVAQPAAQVAPAARPATPVAPKQAAPAAPVAPRAAAPVMPKAPASAPVMPKAPAPAAPKMPTPPAPKMAVPKGTPAMPQAAKTAPAADAGEEISWLYLMQHYNKENAEKYKAQKESKKAKKNPPVAPKAAGTFTVPGAPVQQPVAARPVQQPVAAPKQAAPAQPAPRAVQQQPLGTPVVTTAQVVNQVPQAQNMSFGETTVLGGGGNIGETTVLGAAAPQAQPQPYLIRSKNNEKIFLNKPVFRIGKEKSYVDYFIGDNTAISRSHANILNRDGQFFVVDTNSTNHTYVNGAMIQSGNEIKLNHGDKVRLANEDFEFKLY